MHWTQYTERNDNDPPLSRQQHQLSLSIHPINRNRIESCIHNEMEAQILGLVRNRLGLGTGQFDFDDAYEGSMEMNEHNDNASRSPCQPRTNWEGGLGMGKGNYRQEIVGERECE